VTPPDPERPGEPQPPESGAPAENVYRTADLDGCEVVTEAGEVLGVFKDVIASKAHDIWMVQGRHEYLVPARKDVVLKVDLAAKRILVRMPAGLREIYEA
jgi:16S rRNA processing protein RimM